MPEFMSVTDERWVNHCLRLIILREQREVEEMKEQALRQILRDLDELGPKHNERGINANTFANPL